MPNNLRLIAITALLAMSNVSFAQQPPPPGAAPGHEAGADPAKLTEHLKKIQEQQLQIHDLSNKILAETDPVKKQALKDLQLELLKAHHHQMMAGHGGKMMDHKPAN